MANKIRIVAKYPTYWDGVVELPEGKTANNITDIVDKWGKAKIYFNDDTEMLVDLEYCETDTKYSEEIQHEEYEE
jgi:hypothetical protein